MNLYFCFEIKYDRLRRILLMISFPFFFFILGCSGKNIIFFWGACFGIPICIWTSYSIAQHRINFNLPGKRLNGTPAIEQGQGKIWQGTKVDLKRSWRRFIRQTELRARATIQWNFSGISVEISKATQNLFNYTLPGVLLKLLLAFGSDNAQNLCEDFTNLFVIISPRLSFSWNIYFQMFGQGMEMAVQKETREITG